MTKNISMSEEDFHTVQVGNAASFVYNHMKPILDKTAANALNVLKADFRKGEFDSNRAQAQIAVMCAVDDLDSQLRSQINRKDGVTAKLEIQGDEP